jgi:transcriptional regulator with XRE-family HTH domain
MGRKERLNEVYEYVRKHFPIHTQTDFADRLKYNRTYISSAMNGNERYLTDKLFTNICEAFEGVFNLDYLLTGDGELLSKGTHETRTPAPTSGDSELVQELRNRIADKDCIIAGKDELIESLKREHRTKDALIVQLNARIADLERQLAINDLAKYPFTHSQADHDDIQQHPQV